MAKNLLIVESPAKTRTLNKFLGKDFNILATIGHIRDLPRSKIGVDPDNSFALDYEVIKGKEKVIADLKKAAKKATTIYLAPDPDREGEAIAWHVAASLKDVTTAEFVRVAFNEITEKAVRNAVENPRQLDMNKVNAQQARRALDRIVGYTVSPFLWKTIAYNLSAGRVQSVALRIICEREVEVTSFVPQEYWQLEATLSPGKKQILTARLHKIDDKTVVTPDKKGAKKITIASTKEMDKYLAELKEAEFKVSEIKKSQRQRKPLPPFITSTIQQEAAKVYGFSPKLTMSLAQRLYEGIELGDDGPTGLITYMRTDSTRVSTEALTAVRKLIKKKFGDEYMPTKPINYGKKKGSQDAHEAIRPTYFDLSPEKLKKRLGRNEIKLYTLIYNRFLACQMTPAKYATEAVDIEAGRFLFRATAQKLIFDGYLRVYHEGKEPDENGNGKNGVEALPELHEGDLLSLKELKPTQSFTKPLGRYSEAMLVKRLEADGIGRPSTYATIITTLKDRKYVELEEKKLHPTDLGMAVNKILVQSFPDLFNIKFTANMEKDLDLVEEGTDDWVKILEDFYGPFMDTIKGLKSREKEIKDSLTEKTDIKCEKCGEPMVIKWGRNGRFLACSAYPDCKSTRPLPEEEAKSKTDEKCEKCGSDMVIKSGRFGRFLACSAYPDCKNTKPVTLGILCPRDGCGGKLMERTTKGRRTFYGCSNYPKCDYASWDMPVKEPCPVCKHPFMVLKSTKAKGEHHKCPECKHIVILEKAETTST